LRDPPVTTPEEDLTARLQELSQLYGSGALSDDEFAAARQKLLVAEHIRIKYFEWWITIIKFIGCAAFLISAFMAFDASAASSGHSRQSS